MPLPLIPLLVGAVARTAGTRVVAGAATRAAAGEAAGGGGGASAGRALQYGGRALQAGALRRSAVHTATPPQQQPQQPPPQGRIARTADWARNNPVEAAVGATALLSGSSLAARANEDFHQVTQPRQFSG